MNSVNTAKYLTITDHHFTQCFPMKPIPPDVDFLVVLHPAKSVSVYTLAILSHSWYGNFTTTLGLPTRCIPNLFSFSRSLKNCPPIIVAAGYRCLNYQCPLGISTGFTGRVTLPWNTSV